MQIFQCTSMALVSQGHKDFYRNENSLIYSKAILDWNIKGASIKYVRSKIANFGSPLPPCMHLYAFHWPPSPCVGTQNSKHEKFDKRLCFCMFLKFVLLCFYKWWLKYIKNVVEDRYNICLPSTVTNLSCISRYFFRKEFCKNHELKKKVRER